MGSDEMIFILLLMAFLFSIPGLIIYPIYRVLQNRGHIKSAKALVWGFILVFFYCYYREINPSDSFFIDSFERYTALQVPKSAAIEYKSASSPDPHGKSYDCFRMSLSEDDYIRLVNSVAQSNLIIDEDEPEKYICECTKTKPEKLTCIKAYKIKAPFPTAESIIYFYDDKRTVIAYFINH